jgi:hypothetical protein
MSFLRDVQRASYLISRAAGDTRAAQRGTLGKRVVRRTVTRNAFKLFR